MRRVALSNPQSDLYFAAIGAPRLSSAPDFGSEDDLIEEIKDVRRAHNFADGHAIKGVTHVLRHYMDEAKLDAALAEISDEAVAYWQNEQA